MATGMYATVEYHLVGLFSQRTLHTNAFSARTLPCPTPAAVKLAVLAKVLERDGPARAQEVVDWLAPLAVWWWPPESIVVSTATVRVYKADAGDKPLTAMKGMREYAHFGPAARFGLAMGPVAEERREDLAYALGQIRALGTAESMVQPLAPVVWAEAVPEGWVDLTGAEAGADDGVAVVLDDLGEAPVWERLNVYRVADRKLIPRIGEDRVRRIVVLPFVVGRWSESGYVLVRSGS
jgi:hypothetical protein